MELYRAIKYIRLSYTDDRTVESDSVGNQRRMIDDFIAKQLAPLKLKKQQKKLPPRAVQIITEHYVISSEPTIND